MKKSVFEVIAVDNWKGHLTRGKTYKVYSVTFPKFHEEGLFLVYLDNGEWERISSKAFKPVEY